MVRHNKTYTQRISSCDAAQTKTSSGAYFSVCEQRDEFATKSQLESRRVYLGFDFGMSNIGVAVGQTVTMTATPLKILHAKKGVPNWDEIARLIKDWKPDALIVGVPVHLDGCEHVITKTARKFIASLEKLFKLPVYAAEERLTTKAAKESVYEVGGYKALKREPIDSIAAKLILEGWMRNSINN